jgi:hypothetical protein
VVNVWVVNVWVVNVWVVNVWDGANAARNVSRACNDVSAATQHPHTKGKRRRTGLRGQSREDVL